MRFGVLSAKFLVKVSDEQQPATMEDAATPDSKECKANIKANDVEGETRPESDHGARRRMKRRYKKNQDAINFLRRFTMVVVCIDLLLAISESTLMSTFFLLLTLSTTFDVKPENVIESYCYFAPIQNKICGDYMDRLTGYTSPSSLPFKGTTTASFSSTSTPIINFTEFPSPTSENHFPVVPSRPKLTEKQTHELFRLYNQTFYNPPARFSLERRLAKSSKLSKLYEHLLLSLYENGTRFTNRSAEVITPELYLSNLISSQNGGNFLRQSIELVSPSAPFSLDNIPQVTININAPKVSHKLRVKPQETLVEESSPIPLKFRKVKSFLILNEEQQPLPFYKKETMNLRQLRSFGKHRWKRNTSRKTTTTTPNTTGMAKAVGAEKENSSSMEKPQALFTSVSGKTVDETRGAATPSFLTMQMVVDQKQSKHEPTHPPAISEGKGGGKETQVNKAGNVINGEPGREEMSEASFIKEMITASKRGGDGDTQKNPLNAGGEERKIREADKIVMRDGKGWKTNEKEKSSKIGVHHGFPPSSKEAELMLERLETFLNSLTEVINSTKGKPTGHRTNSPHTAPGGSQAKREKSRWKEIEELFGRLDRSPRTLIGLIESSLFNNWNSFLEYAKRRIAFMNVGCKSDSQCGVNVPSKVDEKRVEKLDNLVLSLEMDIFSPENYEKAERRKKALEQIYHDYSNSLMKQLGSFEEHMLSHTFQSMFTTVKIYTLVWQLTICFLLFFGSVYEDKTALNIWGILNILTSLLHFMVDEWINTTFQPDKSNGAIWFGVVYGIYKPITIILVATLSSEILKGSGPTKEKGLLANLKEIIIGKKRPPLAKDARYLEALQEIIVIDDHQCDSNENGNKNGEYLPKQLTMKVKILQDDKLLAKLCQSKEFRGKLFSKLSCCLFNAKEADWLSNKEVRCTECNCKTKISPEDKDILLNEIKLLHSSLESERTQEEELTDTDSEDDENQLEIVEDDDDDDDDESDEDVPDNEYGDESNQEYFNELEEEGQGNTKESRKLSDKADGNVRMENENERSASKGVATISLVHTHPEILSRDNKSDLNMHI